MKQTKLWWFALLLGLSGCSLLPGNDAPPDQVYRLAPQVGKVAHSTAASLYFPRIAMNPALDNERITLNKPGLQQDFIARSRWPDALSTYLHAVMLDALAASGAFRSVSGQMLGDTGQYKLLVRVSDFQAEYPAEGKSEARVEVVMEVLLLRMQDQRLLKQQRYQVRKENVPVSTGAIVAALNQALGEVLTRMVRDFCTPRELLEKN